MKHNSSLRKNSAPVRQFARLAKKPLYQYNTSGCSLPRPARCDKDGDGEIDYPEFARWFGRGAPPAPPTPEVLARQAAKIEYQESSGDVHQEHLKAIQAAASKRSRTLMLKLKRELSGIFTMNGVSLEQQFRGFDTNGDGAIDHDEFRNGLRALGAQIADEQIDDMIALLDKDGDGEIDYPEFARWFGRGAPPAPPTPEVLARQAARQAAGDMSGLLAEIHAAGAARQPQASPPDDLMAEIRARGAGIKRSTPARRAGPRGGSNERDAMFAELRAAAATRQSKPGSSSAAVQAVVAAMKTNSNNAEVQHAGCQALWSMAYKNDAGRALIVAAGGVSALVLAMNTFASSPAIQASACSALASLAVDDAIAADIVAAGVQDLVVATLSNYVHDASVAEPAMVLLANLA
eukprot:SAG31_NODE_2897_length_4936_cov_3.814348_3_plen_406_part_00